MSSVKNIFIFCVVLCTTQFNISLSLPMPLLPINVVVEYKPILDKLGINLELIYNETSQYIKQNSTVIESLVDVSQTNVDLQVTNLQKIVEGEIAKANASGISIDNCVKEQTWEMNTINLTALDQCRTPPSVVDLQKLLWQLEMLQNNVISQSNMCLLDCPSSGDSLKICFEDLIEETVSVAKEIVDEINKTLAEAQSDSLYCISITLGRLDLSIDGVQRRFESCVQKN